ncbi:hypothetical protein [Brevundimonas sp.]|uniref:hypothetical protein n=1 Tax=Brevundimonas sp. TaxID=1871086 RepID=UPI0028A95268|nr:hypothetical protein [Brevundimonas sp.]
MKRSMRVMKTAAAAAVVGAASLTFAGAAQAACGLSLQPAQEQWVIRYNPFEDDSAQHQFDLALVNNGNSSCNGDIVLRVRGEVFGLSRVGASERVPYAVLDQRNGQDVTPRSGESPQGLRGRPEVQLTSGERGLERFSFVAVPQDGLSQGLYAQTVYLGVRARNGEMLAEKPITLALEVAPAAVMGLKGEFQRSRGTARIELGELTEGVKPLNTSLYVRSTGGYRVSVTSLNQGRLRQAGTDWYVNYGLKLGPRDMNLAAAHSFDVTSPRSRNDDYPLTVRIGDVAGKRAGAYSDTLTFTVAAI